MEQIIGPFLITDDPRRVDVEKVCALLGDTYWAKHRSRELIEKSLKNSINISVFAEDSQIGFARVITDHATFAWIADVIIEKEFQGFGIGKGIMRFVQSHPDIPESTQLLKTDDAHSFYEKYGFKKTECMMK